MVRKSRKRGIEERLDVLESWRNKVTPTIEAIRKTLDLGKERINPREFCKDDLDCKIMDYLIEHHAGSTSEIAAALGLENPKSVGRHTIGKRIKRLKTVSERSNWRLLEFHPENKNGKFRAWWLNIDEIDVNGFRQSGGRQQNDL